MKNEMNRAANPNGLVVFFWCNAGATGMERMETVLLMDCFWLIP